MLMSVVFNTLALVCLLVQTRAVGGQTCIRVQMVGLRNCSAVNCYRCTISNSNNYADIPRDAVAIYLEFSPGSTGLGSTAKLPSLLELRDLVMSLTNLGQSPVIPSGFYSSVGQLDKLTIFHEGHSSIEFSARLVNGSFSGLSNLTQLNAAALGISEIPVEAFKDLVNLRQLDLNQNSLTQVAAGTFAEQRQLVTLSLAKNKISSLANVSFEGLQSLRKLDLYNNEIRQLGRGLEFLSLGNLTDLNLGSNHMVYIDSYAFTGLRKLERLFLDSNNLTNLTANVFNDLTSLAKLDLSRNALQRLPVRLFSNLQSLEWLILSENHLEGVPSGAFNGLQKLETLYLQDNLIQSVENQVFEGLEFLTKLNLSENRIAVVGSDAFASLRRLEWLNLASNQLTSLEFGTTDGFNVSLLTHLDLSLNPWNCSCGNYWLVVWLQMHNLTGIVHNQDSTICQSPAELSNRTFFEAYDDDANHSCPFPFTVQTTPTTVPLTTVPLTPTGSARGSNEEGLSKGAQIGIIIAAVVAAVAIIVTVALVVHFRLRCMGFWDRKKSESVNGLHHGAAKNDSEAPASKVGSNGGYDNRGVISDDGFSKGLGQGQGELPVSWSGTADMGFAVHSKPGSTRQMTTQNNYYVYDNPTVLDDDGVTTPRSG